MKIYFLCFSMFIVSACASSKIRTDFCDTWSTDDGSGGSVTWTPKAQQKDAIIKIIGTEKTYVCAESNPSGRITVVSYGATKSGIQYYAHEFRNNNDQLDFISEEIFVFTH